MGEPIEAQNRQRPGDGRRDAPAKWIVAEQPDAPRDQPLTQWGVAGAGLAGYTTERGGLVQIPARALRIIDLVEHNFIGLTDPDDTHRERYRNDNCRDQEIAPGWQRRLAT